MKNLTFLDLPGEIRNQIYKQLLIVPMLSTPRLLGDPPVYPRILGVCKQVYQEAKEMLYCRNTFLAHPSLLSALPRLRIYYDTIRCPQLISMIRRYHMRIRLDCDPNFSATQATESFSGVEELAIEVFQAQFGSSDNKVLKLFEGVRDVKKVKVYGSVNSFPGYVKWLEHAMITARDAPLEEYEEDSEHVRSFDIWVVSADTIESIMTKGLQIG